jgi:uncharacterized protein
MSTKLYINLPVTDLPKATAFYEAIGFVKNPQFSGETASGMAYDDSVYVMLLTHDFTKTFLPAHKTIADSHVTCEVLNALGLESKEAVDAFIQKIITAGGKITLEYDYGFMYGKDFEDLDGHIWEIFWMDASQMPPAQA